MWGRVVVGVDGSLASLEALRRAVQIARREHAAVRVVLVWHRRVIGHSPANAFIPQTPMLTKEGHPRIDNAFAHALGGRPADVRITTDIRVYDGNAGEVLVHIAARTGDLLVVGTSVSGWLPRRLLRGSVGRYCLRHAHCPVLLVPLPEFARAVDSMPRLSRRLLRSVADYVADKAPTLA